MDLRGSVAVVTGGTARPSRTRRRRTRACPAQGEGGACAAGHERRWGAGDRPGGGWRVPPFGRDAAGPDGESGAGAGGPAGLWGEPSGDGAAGPPRRRPPGLLGEGLGRRPASGDGRSEQAHLALPARRRRDQRPARSGAVHDLGRADPPAVGASVPIGLPHGGLLGLGDPVLLYLHCEDRGRPPEWCCLPSRRGAVPPIEVGHRASIHTMRDAAWTRLASRWHGAVTAGSRCERARRPAAGERRLDALPLPAVT